MFTYMERQCSRSLKQFLAYGLLLPAGGEGVGRHMVPAIMGEKLEIP